MTFYEWLRKQTTRTDAVGLFARYAMKDKFFPREMCKLCVFLQRYEGLPEQRKLVIVAHREWRQMRAQQKRGRVA